MRLATRLAGLAVATALAGCASSMDPLIDRRGVDDARYNRDLAACKQSSGPAILSLTSSVGSCMSAKGYKVLLQ